MRDLMSRLKEGVNTATKTAKRRTSEAKLVIDRKLNQNLFEAIIAGCVLIMNTSTQNKNAQDRTKEEHNLLISLAEKGIAKYFTQEEITNALVKYMSIFEAGNFLAGYGYCICAVCQVKKESDISTLLRFMYDVSAADGNSDPEERQIIVDVAGFLGFKKYAVVEPELTGFIPFKMSEAQRLIGGPSSQDTPQLAPASPPPAPTKSVDDGIPEWMRK